MTQVQQQIEGFRLSPQQRRIWRVQDPSRPLCTQGVIRIDGTLDRERLRRALDAVVDRHEILRIRYSLLPGMELPIQVIEDPTASPLRVREEEAEVDEALLAEERRPFAWTEEAPVRFLLVAQGAARHALVVTLSALAGDPRTLENLVTEIALLCGDGAGLHPVDELVQYVDFAEWQNELLEEDEEAAERREWWNAVPFDRVDLAPLRAAWAPAAEPGGGGLSPEAVRLGLAGGAADAVARLADAAGGDLATAVLTGWILLLQRLTGEERLSVGHLASGRRIEQLEPGVGAFAKYLPLSVPLQPDLEVAEALQMVGAAVEEGAKRQEAFAWDGWQPTDGEQPTERSFLPVLFELHERVPVRDGGGVRFRLERHHLLADRFSLRLAVVRGTDGIDLELAFDPVVLDRQDAERLLERLRRLLVGSAEDLHAPVGDLPLLAPSEVRMIEGWNRTGAEVPSGRTLHELFEEQVRRAPAADAVVAPGERLRYDVLDRRSNRLAHVLLRHGLEREGRVLVALERSAGQIVALLATLKAGGVFVPLDLAQPDRRLAAMVEDLASSSPGGTAVAIVAGSATAARLAAPAGVRVVDLEAERATIDAAPDGPVAGGSDASRLAYAILTSGSTGRPKAVGVAHRSVVNLQAALDRVVYAELDGTAPLKVGLNAPVTFDASVKQWVQLLAGHTLVLIPEEVRADGERFVEWLAQNPLDVLDLTPSQLRLLDAAGFLEAPASSRPAAVLVGGEAVDPALWERLAGAAGTAFFNAYGPTECTVDVTVEPIRAPAIPSVGRPLANVRVHAVDRELRRVPLGIAGELAVAGAGLARGYLDRPGATAERFVPDPFSDEPGGRLYRTGDRVCLRSDGRFELLGRLDQQVKVRGMRVELGEIESALAAHPGVRAAVVELRDDAVRGAALAAYVVPKELRGERAEEDHRQHTLPNGRRIAVFDQAETDFMYQEIFEERAYLADGLELDPGAVVFDVGANIGLFSLFVADESPGATIYAFEPIRPIYDILRSNASHYFPGARLFPFGLGDDERAVELVFYPWFSSRSGLAEYADLENDLEVTRLYVDHMRQQGDGDLKEIGGELDELLAGKLSSVREEGRLRRLSDVVREQSVERIDLLKVDVQRAELDVLRGIDEEHWGLIRQIALEVHDQPGSPTEGRLDAITALLREHGFRVATFQDETLAGTDRHYLVAKTLRDAAEPPAPRSGIVGSEKWHQLPNGLKVVQQNRNETELIYGQIFEERTYLKNGIELGDGAVVFDVGANIGLFSLFVHQHVRAAQIYAFEPAPSSFEKLCTNLARYGVAAALDRRGLSNRAGAAEFVFYSEWTAASGLYADEEEDQEAARLFLVNREDDLAEHAVELVEGRFRGERFQGEVTTLSEVIRERKVDRIDLLKLDVEKSELDILEGIDEEDWPKIRQIVIEVHDLDGRLQTIRELLASKGFNTVSEQDPLAVGSGIHTLYASHRSLREMKAAEMEPDADTGIDLRESRLREYLREKLPEHMIPTSFVLLDELPYNRSGKVDRQALPDPADLENASPRDLVEPRTPVETIVAGLFGEVLGRDRVGADMSFFDLGGHSLLATQLMSRLRESLSIELPLRMLFEAPTVEGLARVAEKSMAEAPEAEVPPLEPIARDGALPLSFAQQGLWLLQQMEPESSSYNSLKALRLKGRFDPRVVASVVTEIVRRHEILRTRCPAVDGRPVQVIEPPAPVALPVVDLRAVPSERRRGEMLRVARREAGRSFDLEQETPLRLALLRLGSDEHVLLFCLHHIAADGWSLAVLDREVNVLYRSFAEGRPSPLPELAVQYADYAVWQRRWLEGEALERQVDFWRRRLAGAPSTLDLATVREGDRGARRIGTEAFTLPRKLSSEVVRLTRAHGSTLYLVLLSAYFVLLHHATDRDDLVIGTAAAGRDHRLTEDLIGLFINMVPMRLQLTGDPTLGELLDRVRTLGLEAYVHQALPFERLVESLGYERQPGRHPVFQVAFGVNNAPFDELDLPGLEVEVLEIEHEQPRFDLTTWVTEAPDGLRVRWTYDRSLFSAVDVDRLHGRFVEVLDRLVAEPETRVRDLEVLSEEERRELDARTRERESSNLRRLRRAKRSEIGVS